jgi:hypothetical protein
LIKRRAEDRRTLLEPACSTIHSPCRPAVLRLSPLSIVDGPLDTRGSSDSALRLLVKPFVTRAMPRSPGASTSRRFGLSTTDRDCPGSRHGSAAGFRTCRTRRRMASRPSGRTRGSRRRSLRHGGTPALDRMTTEPSRRCGATACNRLTSLFASTGSAWVPCCAVGCRPRTSSAYCVSIVPDKTAHVRDVERAQALAAAGSLVVMAAAALAAHGVDRGHGPPPRRCRWCVSADRRTKR